MIRTVDNQIECVDSEIRDIEKSILDLKISNLIEDDSNDQDMAIQIENDFSEKYYDYSKGSPIKNLKIKLGSSDLPRFCCACHKLNLAFRHAIESHGAICKILSKINSSNATIRISVKLNNVFAEKKCRLRIENLTRWSSSFLMLESVKRAFSKGAFNQENEELRCPVSLETVDTYYGILKKVYFVSLDFQKTNSSISDIIPSKY